MLGLEGWEKIRFRVGRVGLLGEVWQRQRMIRLTVGEVCATETWRKPWGEGPKTYGSLWLCRQWSSLSVFEERTLNCWLYIRWLGRRVGIRGNKCKRIPYVISST